MRRSMTTQRDEALRRYEQGGRPDLAKRGAAEITVIEQFLPPLLDEAAVEHAVAAVIEETGAATLKDLGRVMALLKLALIHIFEPTRPD